MNSTLVTPSASSTGRTVSTTRRPDIVVNSPGQHTSASVPIRTIWIGSTVGTSELRSSAPIFAWRFSSAADGSAQSGTIDLAMGVPNCSLGSSSIRMSLGSCVSYSRRMASASAAGMRSTLLRRRQRSSRDWRRAATAIGLGMPGPSTRVPAKNATPWHGLPVRAPVTPPANRASASTSVKSMYVSTPSIDPSIDDPASLSEPSARAAAMAASRCTVPLRSASTYSASPEIRLRRATSPGPW